MTSNPDPLRRCVQQLMRLPGVGERTATRLSYWLLRAPEGVAEEIGETIATFKSGIQECEHCCDLVSASPCRRCADNSRTTGVVCVVEQPQDIQSIERGGAFRGRYHVLHGAISPLDGVGPDDLRIKELLARLDKETIEEVIVATDPDVEGDSTALYLGRLLQPFGVKVTRLAYGLSAGTEIEYADRVSVARAIQNRREI